jgi:hypothetical protein
MLVLLIQDGMVHQQASKLFYKKYQEVNMANLHDAIRALNSSIVTIRGDVAYTQDEQVIQYDMAQAEAKLVELQAQEDAKEQAAKDAKASALAKLAALGLTQDEVKALIG